MTDAESSLRELLEKVAEEQSYNKRNIKVKQFTSGGANYSSAIFFATISSPGKNDLNLFAKVATCGEKFRAHPKVAQLFVAEQVFYNKLMNVWKGLQDKYNVPEENRFLFPKYYGGSTKFLEETVILEDLSVKGYRMHDRFLSVDWEYAAKAMETLAKFHAFSFVHKKEKPEEYEEILKELKCPSAMEENEESKQFWGNMVGNALKVLDEEERSKTLKYLTSGDIREKYSKYNEPRGLPILVHGDYRTSNLLHRKKDGCIQIIPVDYQTIYSGCPTVDLVYFLVTSTDKEFRAKYYEALVEHYYQQLTLALEVFQIEANEAYPREQFDEDLKEMLPYIIMLGVIVLPVVTVEAEHAPRMDGEMENFTVKTSDLFKDRFRGIIDDCVRWGIL